MSRRFESMEGKDIRSFEEVKVKKMNSIIEVMNVKKDTLGGLLNVVKLSKDKYMIVDTGEVKEYVKKRK